MHSFTLHTPRTLAEALDLLERYGDDVRPIAGGTALVLLMQQRLARPGHLVSLGRIPELAQVEVRDSELRIGAAVTHRRIETDAAVRRDWPLLAEAYRRVATVRIRNVATAGGGLAHADPNQDPPASLIVLSAQVEVASPAGTRRVAVEDLFRDYYETTLAAGELITAVVVRRPEPPPRWAYLKFLPRTADDYPTVAVAAALQVEDGRCREARIALNAAGPTPVRARAAEEALQGQQLTPELLRAAAATVPAVVDPLSDHRGSASYKRRMAEVFTRRALEQALGG